MVAKWPETVPVLEPDNFCRGAETRGARHCLVGWVEAAFNEMAYDSNREIKVIDEICAVAEEFGAAGADEAAEYRSPPSVNDNPKNSRKLLARIWNRAMANLGYVVNNPEARYVNK